MINAEEQGDRLVGATLAGNYAVVRIVGEGGMGRVYEARHTRIRNRRFAVKTLHGEYLRQPQALARFRREAEATASIDSPHVVDVYDVGRTPDGQPFIVSEYLKGNDLGDVLSDGKKLPLPRMVRIVRQICKGVAAAHDRGIVHRDLKPDNVFLVGDDETPFVKVVDFGISRVDTAETQLTRTGMIMGTPAYMAPEQARGAAVDARADIYSVGAILYRGLTGKDPFDRDDPAATLAAVLLEEPPPPRSIEPSMPEALELIIQRAMAKEPNARYQHIRELDAALAPFDTMEEVSRGPRPRAGSRSSSAVLGGAEREVRFARTLLTIFAVLGAVAALLALFLAADGIVTWFRGGQSAGMLTATESGVALLAVVSAAITPAILVIRHLQRTVWTSTMRALALMRSLRSLALAGFVAYGAAALAVRIVEAVVLRRPGGVAWPLWEPALVIVGLFGVIYTARRQRQSEPPLPRAPMVAAIGAAALLCIALVASLRGGASAATFPDAGMGATPSADVPIEPGDAAPADALAAARAGGAPALLELSKQYPRDPNVLESLLLAYASKPETHRSAPAVVEALIAIDPKRLNQPSVREAIKQLAEAPLDVSAPLLETLATKGGPPGLDMLYDIMRTPGVMPQLRTQIHERLDDDKVMERASPALRIAYALSKVEEKDCKEVVPLLDTAAKDGDARALKELDRFLETRRCGFFGRSKCPRCPRQKKELERTAEAIRSRGAE